jgi:hypothetical protein
MVSIEENSKFEAVPEKMLPGIGKLPAKSAARRTPKVGVTRIIGDPNAVL